MRIFLMILGLLALAACTPPIPDSGAGVGFRDYNAYQAGAAAPATGNAAQTIPPAAPGTATSAVTASTANLSDEQDFDAVSGRETIESDAARIAANRAQFEVVEVRDLPERSGNSYSLVVEFALATNNAVGQPLFRRSQIFAESRFSRNCARYASSEQAQEAFLKSGGPERDRQGLDPDGDGFACFWSPVPFRQARLAAQTPEPVVPPAE